MTTFEYKSYLSTEEDDFLWDEIEQRLEELLEKKIWGED